MPVSTVSELWPDAVVKLVITRGVDVVNVAHLGRLTFSGDGYAAHTLGTGL